MPMMPNRYLITVLCLALTLCGCSRLSKALVLKGLGTNQEMQDLSVRKLDDQFEKLLEAYHAGKIKSYTSQSMLEESFGQPLFSRPQRYQGQLVETWLYRYHTKPFDSDKIYFYFDDRGEVIDHRFVKLIPKEERQYNLFSLFKKEKSNGAQ